MEEGNKGIFEVSFHPEEFLAALFFYSIVYVIYIGEHILKNGISSVCLNLSNKILLHIGSFLNKNGKRDTTGHKFDGFYYSQDCTAHIQQLLSTSGSSNS